MTAPHAHTFPCSTCGAKLVYDATTRTMRCPYCRGQQAVAVDDAAEIREIPLEHGLSRAPRGYATDVVAVSCGECGATVNFAPSEITADCTFCRSHKVLARHADPNLIRPESILPFFVDLASSKKAFTSWLGTLWFRPSDLRKLARVEEMAGVYVPFWTFDAHVDSRWTAQAGYYYYETEHYTVEVNGRTEHRTRQVRHTRWESAGGYRDDDYDDVLVCASKGLPADLAREISTSFNTETLKPYTPAFLAGWRAESYAIELYDAWATGLSIIEAEQERRCGNDVPGDTHRFLQVDNTVSDVTFKHTLLPVWIAAFRYRGKTYRFLVNGQTGAVSGHAPWSAWKITFFILFILAVIAALVFFFG